MYVAPVKKRKPCETPWQGHTTTQTTPTALARLTSPGEFHPQALPEPYLSLSTHTAPMVKTFLRWRSQTARRFGWRSIRRINQPHAGARRRRSFLYFRQAQRTELYRVSRFAGG